MGYGEGGGEGGKDWRRERTWVEVLTLYEEWREEVKSYKSQAIWQSLRVKVDGFYTLHTNYNAVGKAAVTNGAKPVDVVCTCDTLISNFLFLLGDLYINTLS